MTAEQFAYWLQGYAEMNDAPPSAEQWQAIRDHLALVFNKVTPLRTAPIPFSPVPLEWLRSPPSADDPFQFKPTVTCSLPGNDPKAYTVC